MGVKVGDFVSVGGVVEGRVIAVDLVAGVDWIVWDAWGGLHPVINKRMTINPTKKGKNHEFLILASRYVH
jgi:hypothetical protein